MLLPFILIVSLFQTYAAAEIVLENCELKEECTGLHWCCYKWTTVRISCIKAGLYTLSLVPGLLILSVFVKFDCLQTGLNI